MGVFTQDYGCIVIDNKSKSNRLEEQAYWYKADLHKDLKLCQPKNNKSGKAWNFHSKWFNSDYKNAPAKSGTAPFINRRTHTTMTIGRKEDNKEEDDEK